MAKERSLVATSTWTVALIFFVIVAISIIIEKIIHRTGLWLQKKKKPSLYEALDKIKAELMLVGFISLLLTVTREKISGICIPKSVGHSWHPCSDAQAQDSSYDDPCLAKGKVQLVSGYGVHQLHVFIFVLAVSHVLYCVITYGLGILKMRKWKSWENETRTIQYQYNNDPERFRFARDTSFGRRHLHFWSNSSVLLWIVCFFRQLFTSVQKVDYLTLRNGFISEHLTHVNHATFNFQKYIQRSLEEDFKVIVGISPLVWFIAVLLLLTNTYGWNSPYWLPFIPLAVLLLVGAKLQVIITKLGMRILEKGDVVKGSVVVQPNDDLFWFNRPRFMLYLIHIVLFENAFQLAFFAWSLYEFNFPSCYHETVQEVVIQVSMGVLVQFLCSYVTLPLYALVTQMGSNMKPTIFSEPVASALRKWHHTAKKQLKQGQPSGSVTPISSRPASPLRSGMSPAYLLQGQRNYNNNNNNNNNNEFVESGAYFASLHMRGLVFGNEGMGGEGSSSYSHHQIVEIDDFTRKRSLHESEIERDVENHPEAESVGVPQHEVEMHLSDFSFRQKERFSS